MYSQYIDPKALSDFEHFLTKVAERTEYAYKLRPDYSDGGDPALGVDVEYFSFLILADDRMRYIIENICAIPDKVLSPANKICNTVISHFYGARGIHSVLTGVKDPKKAHVDFELLVKDPNYLQHIKDETAKSKQAGAKMYGSTELHTSLQTAGRNFCRAKYNDPTRPIQNTDILEWVASWTQDGTTDRIIKVTSLKDMFNMLREQPGVGEYYGYHCATSNSVNPALKYQHDERFCAPGPGARESLDFMFKPLKDSGTVKKMPYGDLVIWIRDNQHKLLKPLNVHPFFHNFVVDGKKIFEDEQDELKVYTTEVACCQFGVYRWLKANPHLISKRKVARLEDDSTCDFCVTNPPLKSLLEF
jgi:hypothetical protein